MGYTNSRAFAEERMQADIVSLQNEVRDLKQLIEQQRKDIKTLLEQQRKDILAEFKEVREALQSEHEKIERERIELSDARMELVRANAELVAQMNSIRVAVAALENRRVQDPLSCAAQARMLGHRLPT